MFPEVTYDADELQVMAIESADKRLSDRVIDPPGIFDRRQLAEPAKAARFVTARCRHAAGISEQFGTKARITLDQEHLTRISPAGD